MKEEEEIKGHLFFKMIDWEKLEAREVQAPIIPKIVSNRVDNQLLDVHFLFLPINTP